jgi:hypothetical protein
MPCGEKAFSLIIINLVIRDKKEFYLNLSKPPIYPNPSLPLSVRVGT